MSESREFRIFMIAIAALVFAILALLISSPDLLAEEEDPPREESVVGGKPVRNGQYKFVTALIDETRSGSDYDRQFCGGTLIDRNSVLTAAHCVRGRGASSLEVVIGRTVLSSDQGVTRAVAKVRVHPKFRGSEINSKYDAAVLTLKSTVDGISPIRISRPSDNGLEKPGNELFIAGWGNTIKQQPGGSSGSNFPNRMRQAKVPVVSDSKTKASYDRPSIPSSLRFYPSLMVGAGKTGKDTCQGDSGGPLFSKDGGRIQVGITSYGAGCGAKGYPGVYTEVNSPQIRSFILQSS